jgi:hypothetical protein
MLQMNESNPPTTSAPAGQNKPVAMPAAPQPQQPATSQPKPTTTPSTDHAGEKTKP